MPKLALILIAFLVFTTACQGPVKLPPASPDAKRYPFKGVVVSVDTAKMKAVIRHEKIPNFMDAMTMSFPVRDRDVLQTMSPDAEVKAELVVNPDQEFWLENIVVSAAPVAGQPIPTVNENFAQIDKEVPDFRLTNQDGKAVSMKDFRGKALAVTFIYSRCPLPEYCILMSRQFSDLAIQLEKGSPLKEKVRLLSISFDPATDTPATLKKYGLGYMGKDSKYDFGVWQLATAPESDMKKMADFFGLRYEVDEKDKTQFNHSLRTVVITPEGKVKKIYSGGDWKTDELLAEMEKTLK